ncbi:helix-turn-helix transcriptional regulator [Streptomyces sp. LRa12]|uniref:helix-turn-helix domain-containing protein n=1 Tax=Streptomyces sp. LRa12 TaxID=2563107 RepID=UPI003211D0BC
MRRCRRCRLHGHVCRTRVSQSQCPSYLPATCPFFLDIPSLAPARTSAGTSAESAAGLLGVDRGTISHIESGVRAVSPERVRTLACNCDCADAE